MEEKERETSWTILTITFFLRSVGHVVRNAPTPYAVAILLSLSPPPSPLLSPRTFCPIYPLCLGCNARAGKSREWEENGGETEEEERKGNARTVRGNKLALRHTLLDVPLLSQFLFRIVSPPLCVLACSRSSRTGRSCCLAFRCSVIFPPGDSVLFPFHKQARMDLSFSCSCARARVYTDCCRECDQLGNV